MRGDTMKKSVFAALAIGGAMIAGPATAADLSSSHEKIVQPPPYVAAAFNWTGFYVGVQGGYAFGSTDYRYYNHGDNYGVDGTSDPRGGIVGAKLAYYNQHGSVVWGVLTDINFADAKTNQVVHFDGNPVPEYYGSELNWYGTTQARIGFAADRALFLIGGGLAYGGLKYTDNDYVGWSESKSTTKLGWTIGAAIEYALTDKVSLDVAYNYLDFGGEDKIINYSDPNNYGAFATTYSIVTAGIKVKF